MTSTQLRTLKLDGFATMRDDRLATMRERLATLESVAWPCDRCAEFSFSTGGFKGEAQQRD